MLAFIFIGTKDRKRNLVLSSFLFYCYVLPYGNNNESNLSDNHVNYTVFK